MKWLPQSFNDLLALILIGAIVALWILQGQSALTLRDDTNGALVVLFTLVFYFRRAPTAATNSPETTTTTVSTDTTTTPAEPKG
jgi:hypothetical protein